MPAFEITWSDPAPAPPREGCRRNARYRPALRLAELVRRATSIEYGEGGVVVNGLLLDMPKVFEGFVTTALREKLEAAYGGRVRSQLVRHLDAAGRVALVPDVVWQRRGQVAAVVDAKYKAEAPAGYPNADLYQLLAYCTGHPAVHTVRNADVEIICDTLDLARPPTQLLRQIRGLAACPLGCPELGTAVWFGDMVGDRERGRTQWCGPGPWEDLIARVRGPDAGAGTPGVGAGDPARRGGGGG